ncbi:uncharacterized protein LOC134326515 isoform X2 [Trichomycterus rosablanca]|uniref:uncharacterized protein LOC134326515 isoform X2 n=1 Tax=Trichomycterus rosablanca TaxID=2290929 RepID=UPI002F35D0E3
MRTWFHQQWILVFLCLTEIFSFIGGSTTSGQKVFGIVGESFTFKTGVLESGSINYGTDNIGIVLNKLSATDQDERFKNHLHWDSQTGFFTLTDLRINDSGIYTVQSIKGEIRKQEYPLEIYERVSAPLVRNTSFSSSENEVCTLLCSVKNVRGLKLYWYKNNVLFNETSNSSSLILDLPLEIKKTDNHVICVASNPVRNRSTTVDITEFCPYNKERTYSEGTKLSVWIIPVCAVLFTVVILIMAVCLKKRQQNLTSQRTEGRRIYENVLQLRKRTS